jgi:hypothetical protein
MLAVSSVTWPVVVNFPAPVIRVLPKTMVAPYAFVVLKSVMRSAETGDCDCPPNLPCGCGAVRSVVRVRAPRDASRAELAQNPRSSSARLRVVEKIQIESQN